MKDFSIYCIEAMTGEEREERVIVGRFSCKFIQEIVAYLYDLYQRSYSLWEAKQCSMKICVPLIL